MGLETGTYIQDLVTTNPAGTDLKSVGDDHIRLVKEVLRNTFPNASKAHYFPAVSAKTVNYAILASEMHTTFYMITVGSGTGYLTLSLPALGSGDAGWTCNIMKAWDGGLNPVYIYPPSGTLQSSDLDLAYARRLIPNVCTTAFWTGSVWILSRVPAVPVGTELEFDGTTLPQGYEWPNGQTLNAALYPDYAAALGSGVTPDSRGRVTAGNDTMGGASANRLTTILNGDTDWATGGDEMRTLLSANLPPYTPTGSTTYPGSVNVPLEDGVTAQFATTTGSLNAGGTLFLIGGTGNTLAVGGNVDVPSVGMSLSGDAQGGTSTSFGNVQPTIIKKKILVVE